MPPKDREKLRADSDEIERTLARNRAALRASRQNLERYSQTLTISGAELQTARRALRKAGYLK